MDSVAATTGNSEDRGPSKGLKQPPGATTLRFVMVNDVYDLDMLAYYATALRQEKQNADGKVKAGVRGYSGVTWIKMAPVTPRESHT